MKKQHIPRGWTAKQIRELAEYYDNQTGDEQAADIEAALKSEGQTLLVVPTALVPEILKLLAKKQPA